MRLTLRLAVFLVFFAAQVVLTSHAAAYGDAPHSHDGQQCVVTMTGSHFDDKVICGDAPKLPPAPAIVAFELSQPLPAMLVDTVVTRPHTRAPPYA